MDVRRSVLVACTWLAAVPVAALTPHLVKDINTVPRSAGSDPQGYRTVGGLAYFSAVDGETGRELWRTDGTSAGTFQVLDACPGRCSGDPSFLTQNARGALFFLAATGEGGATLWVTGGTPASTFSIGSDRFRAINEGIWYALLGGEVLYYAADDGVHGRELWRTDGTPAGTFMAADIRPGPEGSNPGDLTEFKGRLYFRASDGQRGPSLWRTDGTAAGTQPVRDPIPSSASHGGPTFFKVVGGRLFFVAPVKGRGPQLWKSDGTTKGTEPLTSSRFSTVSPFFDFSALGPRLIFVASDPAKGQELWVSDGTPKGTRALSSFSRAEAFANPGNQLPELRLPRLPIANRLIFRADDGPHGIELWTTDGTPKGTRLLRDLCPGACHGAVSEPLVANGIAYFTSWDGTGMDPWRTDGTAAGTRLIRKICGDAGCRIGPHGWNRGPGAVFFVVDPLAPGPGQLWRTDGTAQGTVPLPGSGAPEAPPFGDFQGAVLAGNFLYSASDSSAGTEPWLSTGTDAGTRLLADINLLDFGGSRPRNLKPAGDKAYLLAEDGEHGTALWVSDGTAAGTRFVFELSPTPDASNPLFFESSVETGGRFFFITSVLAGPGLGYTSTLWSTDGTTAGTTRFLPDEVKALGYEMAALGQQVFFAAFDEIFGQALWVTDGTSAGTRRLAGLQAFPGLKVFQGRLYFIGCTQETGCELWRTDGTPGGTALVKDIDARPIIGSGPTFLTEHGGRLYFVARDEEHSSRLWSTDGTAAGTLPAALTSGPDDLVPYFMVSAGSRFFLWGATITPNGTTHPDGGLWVSDGTLAGTRRISDGLVNDPRGFAVFNGEVYFSRSSDNVLWKSDGTEAGTVQVLTREGHQVRFPTQLQVLGGRLVFTTNDRGWLFETDGTQEGTVKLRELSEPGFPGPTFELVRAGSRLLFRSWDGDTGSELWALE